MVVGREAENAGAQPRVVGSIKRLMGRTWQEAMAEKAHPKYFRTDGEFVRLVKRGETDLGLEIRQAARSRVLWPHEISAFILKEARRHAEKALRVPISGATITVPAYFRDPHRAATLDAARVAGLEVAGPLLDEPTAAALAFAPVVGFRPGEQVLVADWGGGTLDVTVLMAKGAEWVQVAIAGDLVLGGDDVDHALASFVLAEARQPETLMADDFNRWTLLHAARQAKERLSDAEETTFVPGHPVSDRDSGRPLPPLNRTLRRADLEHLLAPFLERARSVLADCLDKPDVDREGIRRVLLVGGSSRIPAFRRVLRELLPAARLCEDVDPMEAVALGAAVYAERRPAVARICPYGYEVFDSDGGTTEVIPPDTEVPTPEHVPFAVEARTSYADQTLYRMSVRSFESDGNGGRRRHGEQRLFGRGLPPTPAGTPVLVELSLDEHKTLKARCLVGERTRAYDLEGRQEAEMELFGRVANAAFTAEALLEVNQKVSGGLIQNLRLGVERAKAVLDSKDREQAHHVELALKDLQIQVRHKREAALTWDAPLEDHVRSRVAGWATFFESDLLPHFWNVLDPEPREKAVERLRAVRLALQTRAPAAEAEASLSAMEEALFSSAPIGPALRGWRFASALGVPDRMADGLRAACDVARTRCRRPDRKAFEEAIARVKRLLAEADATWRSWNETGAVIDVRPDLVIRKKEDDARGN